MKAAFTLRKKIVSFEKKKNEFENESLGKAVAKCDLLFDHVFFLYFVCLLSNAMSFCHDQYSENMIKNQDWKTPMHVIFPVILWRQLALISLV